MKPYHKITPLIVDLLGLLNKYGSSEVEDALFEAQQIHAEVENTMVAEILREEQARVQKELRDEPE